MKRLWRVTAMGLLLLALPTLGWTQGTTDRSEMDQWVKDTQNQGPSPVGARITMANWQQYKQFMPLGMQKLFQGTYFWKMPANVEINVGPVVSNTFLPKTWVEATEKYGPQTQVEVLPNGHYVIKNYHGGTPFPNPQEPHKGWKILANVFWGYVPSVYVNGPNNYGSVWSNDRFGNSNTTTLDVVYRWSDFNTDPGFPVKQDYAPGTWYTEWLMEESPEQAPYTSSLNLFFVDQEKQPFPDTFVFVPALRRSLRLASTARCSDPDCIGCRAVIRSVHTDTGHCIQTACLCECAAPGHHAADRATPGVQGPDLVCWSCFAPGSGTPRAW